MSLTSIGQKYITGVNNCIQRCIAPNNGAFCGSALKADCYESASGSKSSKNFIRRIKDYFSEFIDENLLARGSFSREDLLCTMRKVKVEQFEPEIKIQHFQSSKDAVKFLRSTFGIQEIDKDMPLPVLNWIAEGLSRASNAHKGFLAMPKRITYRKEDYCISRASMSIFENDLNINPDFFSEKGIRRPIENVIRYFETGYLPVAKLRKVPEGNELYYASVNMDKAKVTVDDKLLELYKRYAKNKNSLNEKELYTLSESSFRLIENAGYHYNSSSKTVCGKFHIGARDCFETIYHELGHFQDYAKAFREIEGNLEYKKFGLGEFLKIRQRGLSLGESFPLAFTPFGNFILNPVTQRTAGKVSFYAQRGIGEFIAEVYAQNIAGIKHPADVLALYKKYNGPTLPIVSLN